MQILEYMGLNTFFFQRQAQRAVNRTMFFFFNYTEVSWSHISDQQNNVLFFFNYTEISWSHRSDQD